MEGNDPAALFGEATDVAPDVSADIPIASEDDDELGRAGLSRLLARQAVPTNTRDGFVLGVTGAWGSGKTSVFRMVEARLGDTAIVVHFNPWLFSKGDDLVAHFLAELAAALPGGIRKSGARAAVEKYADVVVPVGGVVASVAALVKKVAGHGGAEGAFKRVSNALTELPRRVVVFVDDVDRLSSAEIADLVRLVKLVGGFPNTTYLLAYDTDQVEKALQQAHGGSGRAYLEKIVQASHPMPYVDRARFAQMLDEKLTSLLPELLTSDPSRIRWSTGLRQVITPLLSTVRDVKRITNVAVAAVELTGEDVSPIDVVLLEVLRLRLPDLHAALPNLVQPLTRTNPYSLDGPRDEADKKVLEKLIADRSDAETQTLRAALTALFPATGRLLSNNTYGAEETFAWRNERRVAHRAHLLTYLMKTVGDHAVASSVVAEALDALSTPGAFGDVLRELPQRRRADLLSYLRYRIHDITPEQAESALIAVISSISDLEEQPRTFFDAEPEFAVRPLAGEMLASVPPGQRPALGSKVLDGLERIYPAFRFVQWFGWRGPPAEDSPPPLFDEATTERLKRAVAERANQASPEEWVAERQLSRVVVGQLVGMGGGGGRARLQELCTDDEFLLAFLTSAAARQERSTLEGNIIEVEGVTLDWDALGDIIEPGFLSERVLALADAPPGRALNEDERAALSVAKKHAQSEHEDDNAPD